MVPLPSKERAGGRIVASSFSVLDTHFYWEQITEDICEKDDYEGNRVSSLVFQTNNPLENKGDGDEGESEQDYNDSGFEGLSEPPSDTLQHGNLLETRIPQEYFTVKEPTRP